MTERISQDFSKFLKLSQSKETETEIETKDFSEQRNDRKNFSRFFKISQDFSKFLKLSQSKETETEIETKDFSEQRNDRKSYIYGGAQ